MNLCDFFRRPARREPTVHDVVDILHRIRKDFAFIMTQLSDLQDAVAAEDTIIQSAITLIDGIADRIAAAGADPAALQALTDDIKAQSAALAGAVTANTPAPAA